MTNPRNKGIRNWVAVSCDWCGKSFEKSPVELRNTKHNFCSRKCSGHYQSATWKHKFDSNFVRHDDGCWIWVKKKNSSGYGQYYRRGTYPLAHRASWELYRGPIPEGLEVCHKCDVKLCVNPDHLFLGTHSDNMVDMVKKGRRKFDPARHGTKLHPESYKNKPGPVRITAEKTKVVRELYASGVGPSVIAKQFGIARQHVWVIVNSKRNMDKISSAGDGSTGKPGTENTGQLIAADKSVEYLPADSSTETVQGGRNGLNESGGLGREVGSDHRDSRKQYENARETSGSDRGVQHVQRASPEGGRRPAVTCTENVQEPEYEYAVGAD